MISYRPVVAVAIVAVLGFFGISRMVTAQEAAPAAAEKKEGKKGGDRRGGGPIFKVANELTGITQEQKDKIQAIQTSHSEKVKALRGSGEAGGRPDKTKMQELMKETRTQIEALLTDAQKAELTEKMKAAEAERKAEKGNKGEKDDKGTSESVK